MNEDYRLTEYDVPNINLKEKKKANIEELTNLTTDWLKKRKQLSP